jgi:hypothetical protein
MNTSGNLIRDESIMMFDGMFVGGTARSIPIAEKQYAPIRIVLELFRSVNCNHLSASDDPNPVTELDDLFYVMGW